MRLAWLLVTACGCNQVFGLEDTMSPPPDAAPTCPTTGAPLFAQRLGQTMVQSCTSYTASETAGRAFAYCYDVRSPTQPFAEGPPDQRLTQVTIPPPPSGATLGEPRLAASGDEVWFQAQLALGQFAFSEYHRGADGQWTWKLDHPLAQGHEAVSTAPVGPPEHRHVVVQLDPGQGASTLVEYVDDGSGAFATSLPPYAFGDLGVQYFDVVNMTGDGLHLVFYGENPASKIFFASRGSLDERFAAAVPLDNVPYTMGVHHLTSDCGRLYFTALQTVFFAIQR